ncbi:S8 family serine peptidase [Dokdonella sp.]|uniref:S8 family serine peptidase n=1 Tax=Dokdonella sp. TaxID=2291710 RepID=UPI00378363AA
MSYQGGTNGMARTAPHLDGVSANSSRKFEINSSAAQAYKAYLEQQRAVHMRAIEQALGRPVATRFTYDVTMNGVSVALSAGEAVRVAALPGVKSVKAVGLKNADTFRGPKFIGADKIWDGTAVPGGVGTRGEGVKVGIIDTGTNIGHPSFADDATCGFSGANPKLFPRDCTVNNGTSCTGTNPDAAEGDGHGVHTSSTAAGNTIDNTYTPAPLLPDGIQMSGVAPCATVYSYRVADDGGSIADDYLQAAFQNAITDQVDVANYSIGPTCGGGNPWDELAFLDMESADIFVAASAGNTRATCTNPTGLVANNGPWEMTVAASTQDQILAPTISAAGPGTPPPATQNIPLIQGSTTLPINADFNSRPMRTNPANPIGCTATGGIPAGYFGANEIAILRRGTCSFTEKITNAYNAGSRLVLIGNNQPGSISMNTTGAPADVAAFSMEQVPGDALIAFVDANEPPAPIADRVFANGFDGPTAADGAVGDYRYISIGAQQGDVLAKFSFRGPTQAPYDNLTKPDITGPGVNIYAALTDTEGSYGLLSGTSMSSPHLAGSGALVRAAHPTWTPMEVKSAIQTTAFQGGFAEDGVTPWNTDQVGSGRVDLTKAALAGLTLDETTANFHAANPAGGSIDQSELNLASMRNVHCGASCSWTRTFKNQLTTTGNWTVTTTPPAGYTLSASPTTFSLAPGATQAVTFTATGSASTVAFGQVLLHEDASQSPDQHLTVAVKEGDPAIGVNPTSLSASLAPNATTTANLDVTNVGGHTLTWNVVTGPQPVTVWDQPQQGTSGDLSTVFSDANFFVASDFAVASQSNITTLTAYGFDNASSLATQPSLRFTVYSDVAGQPSGNPQTGTGTSVWSYTTTPTGAGVTIGGSGIITLDLAAASQSLSLAPGTYWLSVVPTYTNASTSIPPFWAWFYGAPKGTADLAVGSGYGVTSWTPEGNDFAFNIQGTVTCGAPWLTPTPTSGSAGIGVTNSVSVGFNSTGMVAGTYNANLCLSSNDAAHPITVVPVTMTVTTPLLTFTQDFDDITLLAGLGWLQVNHSTTIGTTNWFQGNATVFPAFNGATNSYIGANYNNTTGNNTISNWLVTPSITFASGSSFAFYTREAVTTFPDRLQVRLCTGTAANCSNVGTTSTDVGNFTTLLLDINPTYTTTGYPQAWTQFTIPSASLPTSGTGRIALRYFVEGGGPSGANSDYIGIDNVVITAAALNSVGSPSSPFPQPDSSQTGAR